MSKTLEFAVRPPSSIIDAPWGWELQKLQEDIRQNDKTALEDRWEYGKVLLRRRGDAKQLPHGTLDALVARDGISRSEIKYRMQFAAAFPTKREVATAVATYATWSDLRRDGLPKKPKAKSQPQAAFAFRRWRETLATFANLTASDRRELAAFVEAASTLLADAPAAEEVSA